MKKLKIFKKKEKKSHRKSVTLFLSGYNLERCLNILSNKGINLFSVVKKDAKNSEIEVLSEDEKYVTEFLKSKNIEIKEKKYNGLAKIGRTFVSRLGVAIGIFVCFCVYIVASGYTLKIEVMGNEKSSDEEIVKVLAENGVGVFSPLNRKSNGEIERIILDNFDEVSMVSVVKRGTSIIVNIKEKLLNKEYEDLDKTNSLVATEDGIITDIKLIQGTLLVKVGDTVRAGDPLVAPYVIDSSGNKIPIEPKAEISADVWLSGEATFEETKQVTKRTGNYVTQRKMTFLDKEIVTSKEDIPFMYYDIETKEEYLSDYILPIKYTTIIYHELETQTIVQSFSDVEKEVVQEAKNLAKSRMIEGDEIKAQNYITYEKDGKTTVSYSITVKRTISD
ncbi:MAG: sporulation protein YqfD [Firmicutes bacterium]|nr:sporulation protein YqfD [Bacillota bacterium]MDY3658753.1 sporulation protein YqfD [Eubacteriales bacterium]